jgi:hypothetical protein
VSFGQILVLFRITLLVQGTNGPWTIDKLSRVRPGIALVAEATGGYLHMANDDYAYGGKVNRCYNREMLNFHSALYCMYCIACRSLPVMKIRHRIPFSTWALVAPCSGHMYSSHVARGKGE